MSHTETLYPNALAIGTQLMEYRLESILGLGGFGITYRARDTLLEKDVAIKEYFPGGAVSRAPGGATLALTAPDMKEQYETGLERFLREARTLANFSHPHIVRVNRYFKANGTGYMVMDYEDGESLKAWLKRNPHPPEDTLKALMAPLLDGIDKVHATGFLHRDIKPENIYVRRRGDPVLIDFGSARQAVGGTATLTTLVTPGYAPFEQYSPDAEQGPWTDLYALGGVLFYAVTGRNPPEAIGRMKSDPVPAQLDGVRDRYSPDLLKAITWAMAPQDADRPRSVAQWREVLLRPVAARTAPAAGTPSPAPLAPSVATQPPANTQPPTPTSPTTPRTEPIDLYSPTPDTQDIGKFLARRDELDRAVREKFQRVLTVMFTDLKGSTAIAEASGDLAVRAMLKQYHDLCADAVRANGGTLVKTIGDGSLSHFVDALSACRAAAAIQRGMEQINLSRKYNTLLLARIGLHTGECILEKNDVFGDVVNTASRFESSARAGEIFISEETYNAVSDKSEFYIRFDREVTLKGKSQPFRGYIVFWDPKEIERDRAQPVAPARPATPFWKIGVFVGVPLMLILAVAWWVTTGGKPGGDERRSINYSVPGR